MNDICCYWSIVFPDVDFGGLSQVKLFIGSLLHQVEQCVFQNELHQINERFLHKHLFLEQICLVHS